MKKFLISLMLVLTAASTFADEYSCNQFTAEQRKLLKMAMTVGYEYDRHHTLAAMVWKESMVGSYIIRVNASDGGYGSFGVAHMQMTTAMYILGLDNHWHARANLVPLMMNDDFFAMTLAMEYLNRHRSLGYRGSIARYNGAGPAADAYAADVIKRVKVLESCEFLDSTRATLESSFKDGQTFEQFIQ